ncbi:hypothetical protein K0504_08495 [Neiella marina]|uniref:Uncharacterized protein n=1 Tax=Neiella holothuriorum TaxID=2870530 RepID=A0ABS7EFP0_9GAMM|nr:hypothetical protein [Neiella holothuriorum]MBW8191070.1 hypothetical protein [Neiella holothuriorum]
MTFFERHESKTSPNRHHNYRKEDSAVVYTDSTSLTKEKRERHHKQDGFKIERAGSFRSQHGFSPGQSANK